MFAAIDGCKGGWLIAMADRWPCEAPVRFLHAVDFADCISKTNHCTAVMVDMPIGLPSGAEERACDKLARKNLTGASGSVFRTPPRSTLEVQSAAEFQARHRAEVGIGGGLPVWGIIPKLKDVDRFMRDHAALQSRVREFHPEVAWRRLAGETLRSKHTGAGLLQRLSILNHAFPKWLSDMSSVDLPKEIQLDDVLDAVVGLCVAQAIANEMTPLRRFPESTPPVDECGLLMEISVVSQNWTDPS